MTRPVLLVNPNRMKPPVAPLALDYLGEALRCAGFTVDLLDLCFSEDPIREIQRYFASHEPLLTAVTIRNTDDVYYVSQDFCLEKYREIIDCLPRSPDVPIVLGGCGYSIFPEAILDYYDIDLGIWGEGEMALPSLAQQIADRGDLSEVPGLVYRVNDRQSMGGVAPRRIGAGGPEPPTVGGRGGKAAFRRSAAGHFDLSRGGPLPRNIVDNGRYFREGGQVGIEAKRGCPLRCSYCADFLGKSGLSLRSPKSVVDEMALLVRRGMDHFHFCDSEFNLPASNAEEVCAEIIARGLGEKVRWYAYTSPAPFTEELAGLFRQAGCAGLDFGADSGNNLVLRNLGRSFSKEDLVRTGDICRRYGLVFMYDLLLGGPGETRESLKETIDLMKQVSPDRVGVSLGVRLFPGTRLAGRVLEAGPLASNPNLRGRVSGNESLLAPVFYLSTEMGWDCETYLSDLIGGDERFLFASGEAANYNYNDNSVLVQAIKEGYRGAYWDILRRVKDKKV